MMAISNAIDTGELMVVMVEEVQPNHLLDAVELLPIIWTGSSYVDSVKFTF